MITFSNKTRNGNFVFSDDSLVLYMNGSYSLKESNDLASINFSFGSSEGNLNNISLANSEFFEGANEKNKEICENYDLIIAAIKANYTD